MANQQTVVTDQMQCSVVSDLGLHCLPITLLEVSKLNRVKTPSFTVAVPLYFVHSVFLGVMFCNVISCHSNLLCCLGRAVFHDSGFSQVTQYSYYLF